MDIHGNPRKLSPLQKICFIRAMRIDCLKAALINFISEQMPGAVSSALRSLELQFLGVNVMFCCRMGMSCTLSLGLVSATWVASS